ncbi:MAG: hypothetical protein FAF03_07080 [Epsilonproteobacteria bacterium]|nr:hypothetical protein [Campylobacterota bacterium]
MKKIIILMLVSFLFVGCGPLGCDGEPPTRATLDENGGYGMRYHFTLYEVLANGGVNPHNLSVSCKEYEYYKSEIYTDDLGAVNGSQVIWKNRFQGRDMQTSEQMAKLTFTFSDTQVQIDGFENEYSFENIDYKVETSSPESWGIPIFVWRD